MTFASRPSKFAGSIQRYVYAPRRWGVSFMTTAVSWFAKGYQTAYPLGYVGPPLPGSALDFEQQIATQWLLVM